MRPLRPFTAPGLSAVLTDVFMNSRADNLVCSSNPTARTLTYTSAHVCFPCMRPPPVMPYPPPPPGRPPPAAGPPPPQARRHGRMEAVGMAVDAEGLERKAGAVQARMDVSAGARRGGGEAWGV